MENKNVRKSKALLILPLVVIWFLTFAFWAAGGGKGTSQNQIAASGLNMQLPNAHLRDDKGENKLSFYEESERDSARFREMIKTDPLYQISTYKDTSLLSFSKSKHDVQPDNYTDPNEEKVYQKIAKLNQQLNSPAKTGNNPVPYKVNASVNKEDVDRLEGLMQNMNKDSDADPEIQQLNGMMEKILDIQHPERIKNIKEKTSDNLPQLFSVSNEAAHATISLLDTIEKKDSDAGFYGLENETVSTKQNAIEAVVHENQILVSGAVIKIRLLNDININGTIIPKDNFVFGTCSMNGERLNVEISSIRSGNSLYPVQMEVYDMDGLVGIYIPGAITRDVAKSSADNSLQMVNMTSVDPSITAQATSAGINAAKTLLSKKVKLVKVFVKAGYKILLKEKNLNQ